MKVFLLFLMGVFLGAGAFYYYGTQITDKLPITLPAQTESVAGVPYATDAWKVLETGFVSGADYQNYWGYRLEYPRDFEASGYSAFSSSMLSRLPGSVSGWKISFPSDAFAGKKTNFGEAWMVVDFASAMTEDQCFDMSQEPNLQALPDETIHGITYHVYKTAEPAAGNLYDTKIYRAIVESVCVEVSQTLHTGNIGNYEPGAVSEFDTKQTDAIFAELFDRLSFTQTNPNF